MLTLGPLRNPKTHEPTQNGGILTFTFHRLAIMSFSTESGSRSAASNGSLLRFYEEIKMYDIAAEFMQPEAIIPGPLPRRRHSLPQALTMLFHLSTVLRGARGRGPRHRRRRRS